MYLEFFSKLALILLVFLLPLETRWIFDQADLKGSPFEYGTGALYLTDILLFISVFLTVLWKWRNNGSEKFSFIYFLIVGFGLMSLAGIGQAEDRKIALYAVMRLWEGLILWWLIQNNPAKPLFLIMAFIGSAMFEAAWGIEQFFFQIVPANKWLGEAFHSASILGDSVLQTSSGRFLRAYGTLPHPNILGGLLAAAILLLSGLLANQYKQPNKSQSNFYSLLTTHYLLLWSGLIVLLFGLFFSFSRSAWLALGIGILFGGIWMIAVKQKRVIMGFVFVIVVCAAMLVLIFPESLSRFSQNQSLEILSVSERVREYDDAQIIVREKPFVGIGINQYVKELQNIYPSFPAWKIHPIHNIYLLILSELGIIGLLIFIIIIAWHLSFLKINSPPLLIWSTAAAISLLAIGLFDHCLWSLHFGILLFWLILGINHRLAVSFKQNGSA
ncbi:MAG TPA: O-antigen ligase family protein [Patescibacteria group bacterium]|nr:O-antigen ligase family protein [Patescibacteria group bacterium]